MLAVTNRVTLAPATGMSCNVLGGSERGRGDRVGE